MKKVVILSGAGISAESGISTFRDSGGLWEQHDVMDVASVAGWKKKPALVLEFYNLRRSQLEGVEYSTGAEFGFREAVSQHEWRTHICVRYHVTS